MRKFLTLVVIVVALGACAAPGVPVNNTRVSVAEPERVSVNPDISRIHRVVGIPGHPGDVGIPGHPGDVVAHLTIRRMGLVSFPVRKGVTLAQLALGPGIYRGSPAPGSGNFALAGHDVTPVGPWDHGPFHFIDQLRPGDRASVEYHGHTYRYKFARRFRVTPDHTNVLRSQRFDMTMTTCWPPGSAAYRMVAQWVIVK